MRFAKFINSVNIMNIRFYLEPNFDLQKFEYAVKILSKLYNTRVHSTKRRTPFATEICYHINDNILHMFMNHKYYDGKVLSILAKQLDELYQNKDAVLKREFNVQIQTYLPFELGLQLYNKQISKFAHNGKKIKDF